MKTETVSVTAEIRRING